MFPEKDADYPYKKALKAAIEGARSENPLAQEVIMFVIHINGECYMVGDTSSHVALALPDFLRYMANQIEQDLSAAEAHS